MALYYRPGNARELENGKILAQTPSLVSKTDRPPVTLAGDSFSARSRAFDDVSRATQSSKDVRMRKAELNLEHASKLVPDSCRDSDVTPYGKHPLVARILGLERRA